MTDAAKIRHVTINILTSLIISIPGVAPPCQTQTISRPGDVQEYLIYIENLIEIKHFGGLQADALGESVGVDAPQESN